MIFVTVGTHQFDALIAEIDRLVGEAKICESVVAQIGNGKYQPRHCEWFRFQPSIEPYIRQARLVVSHGGATVYEVLELGKRLIGVANPDIMEGHQTSNLTKLAEDLYLLWCRRLEELESLIHAATPLRPYEAGTEQLVEDIRQFIEG
jgi:beta-1,4-N-acetylglucosaminyltransferase